MLLGLTPFLDLQALAVYKYCAVGLGIIVQRFCQQTWLGLSHTVWTKVRYAVILFDATLAVCMQTLGRKIQGNPEHIENCAYFLFYSL